MRWLSAAALIVVSVSVPSNSVQAAAAEPAIETTSVGVAAMDITPSYPVRLSGFGFRREESEGVTQRIWAKALAIGGSQPVVLITVDNCGVSAEVSDEVAERLKQRAAIPRERVAVTSTHTHTAPMLRGVLPNLFGQPIPPAHQDRIDRYTLELTDKLEQVALAALADRKPATMAWGIGKVDFAINRRDASGPVDHDLPVLVVRDPTGHVRAIYLGYATHCVTLRDNKISGDWAGYAQDEIQRRNPGAIALISVGCGAESNPKSRPTGYTVESAAAEGAEIADEVQRLLSGHLTPLGGEPRTLLTHVDLPLAPPPARAEWEKLAQRTDPVGYNARVQLGRLDRGEPLRTSIRLPVQTWAFGDRMAMVFIGGEVVQDYSLRLKRELDGLRLWTNGYSNDVPCYIPSERVLKLGAYEGRGAMVYYDVPGPFAAGLEQKIVDAVGQQIGQQFASPVDPQRTQGSRPLSPQQAVAALQTHDELTVDLMVAEPLIADPVAIDFGPDGRLWVAEMYDYPAGARGDFQPGGRVRLVEDADGDGRYDRSTVFLDGIPFPTGVTVWRKGVLVCAAPDILYAEDTDGDRQADVVRKLYSGFGTQNYQARVNSLQFGLDNWVYGSCGLFGGRIESFAGTPPVELGDRDFRIRPDTGVLEPATGRTQQGRVRDDWGNWFGCSNGNFCRHYPLADHYLRRNPHLAARETTVSVPIDAEALRVYPARADLQLFKLSGKDRQATSACGLGIYRDDLLGEEYRGDAFTCEPVNLVVHRLNLVPRDSTFAGRRPATEPQSEFLASTDKWFRPVQAVTGPDGGLWVVDMCRYVIEHPKFIPPEDLAKIDVRAGDTLGRIYRVRPKASKLRPHPRLDRLDTAGLVAALDSPNGWQRDLAGQMLLWNPDKSAAAPLRKTFTDSSRAEARLHA
ncbi:MAG: neutral/alkaline non-lysosomal ceramidase N-terminal domain-containing protein, partial [Planctomycetes bacterium]|nr:neutral/alkaline non-lysosomal ceramidase N-terminal domain-containing protein [Planctomycetota bacterium]